MQQFDLETASLIGDPIITPESFTGLEYVGEVLYGTSIIEPRGPSYLYTIDPIGEIFTMVGPTGYGPITGLAWDEVNEIMYGVGTDVFTQAPTLLFTINLETGEATPIGQPEIHLGSLQFGPDGQLYAGATGGGPGSGGDRGNLYVISTNPGEATLVGNTGFDGVTGLTLGDPIIESPTTEVEKKKTGGGDNQWDTRPTFGISHEDRGTQVVENGFRFNSEEFMLTDNHHTNFAEQAVEVGTINSFSATVYADKRLKIQEFLFGIPNVGESHLAELGIEVWYDFDGNIEDVKVVQKSEVIDADTISVSHEKTKCLSTDSEPLCDTTTVSMTFLEPLADKVMAIKAIDFKNRDQRTYLNDGFDVFGDSLNPMLTKMIPSNMRDQGLLKVTQLSKYSPYWTSEDGRTFEMNSFGSFKEINQTFERFADTGDARTRVHSGFGGILQYEQNRAEQLYDASQYVSQLPESFAYIYPESGERISDELLQEMLLQAEIAKGVLEQMDKQNRHY
jgi:hypothetical protein